MTLDENSGSIITLDEAQKFVQDFRAINPQAIKAFYVGKNKVEQILSQADCMGMRIYNGYDSVKQENNMVLVGVNSAGQDMTDGIIVERLYPCAPYCDNNSLLLL